jgi:hypothetical protein
LEKIIYHKLGLKDGIKTDKTFTKKPITKIKIKRIRIEVEYQQRKGPTCNF